MSVAKGHRYEVGGVRRQSPYLQELCVYFGQFTCYASAEALLAKTLRIDVSDSSIFRLTNQVGEGCEVVADQACLSQAQGRVVYAMADGSMVLTRQDGWREVKVGRIFADCHHGPVSEGRSAIARSLYVAHLGGHQHFEARWAELLDPFEGRAAQMVFISDGALWIRDFVSAHYPSAVQILDFYHAKEHLGEFAKLAFADSRVCSEWVERMADLLLESEWRAVIEQIGCCPLGERHQKARDGLVNYLESNAYRMDYKRYREKGWLIGSGPVEAAHRTLVQQRLKLSGQRWNIDNAQRVLNLRACELSGQWDTVVEKCRLAA